MPAPSSTPPRRPVLRFWLVATAAEVALAGALILTGGDAAIERGLDATGLTFNTDLATALRLAVLYPAAAYAVVLSVAAVAAPDFAVVVVSHRIRRGPGSAAALRRRFRPWSRQVGATRGLRVWMQMMVLFVALSLCTASLDALVFDNSHWSWHRPSLVELMSGLLIATFLDAGAVFEENGWRGFALPLLLQRWAPVPASVVLGLGWALWHFPVKYSAVTDYGVAGLAYLGAFTLKIVLLSIVMTYFWHRAGGTTIIAIGMHGLSNDSLRLQGDLLGESLRVSVLSELTIAAPLALVAAVLAWRTQGRLGGQQEAGPNP